MKRWLQRLRPVTAMISRHTSAGVALLLIIAALVIGYRIGRPAPEARDDAAGSSQTAADGG